ncbi:MAG: hypothetical protein RLZZ230_266 [Candidatus Parcubacteria bacterium]|jgi:hypothetical protein
MSDIQNFLNKLNSDYVRLHRNYENLFWVSYMGDNTVGTKRDKALSVLDNFRSNEKLRDEAVRLQEKANPKLKVRLQIWIDFFAQYQMSVEAKVIKQEISQLETTIGKKLSERKEGYIEASTNKFIVASTSKMRAMIQSHPDENVRKACYQAREELALSCLEEYVLLVKLRNKFALAQGYTDFYDYKLQGTDKMTKRELFSLFDEITDNTKSYFKNIRELEKTQAGLRQPWNFSYFMAGDFTDEEDKYFKFDQALSRWGRSFSALGIDFKDGKLKLDLLDRKGKWSNGFCHWPELVHFENGKRISGAANFTCNVVASQVGSGVQGFRTLFHEGAHAAHFLNVNQTDVCLNHEYAPMTAAWAEAHSMFIDTMFDSIEWKQRYAQDESGQTYPLELFARKVKKLNILKPAMILSTIFVCTFEREVYELNEPTREKIITIAKKNHRRFYDSKEDSLAALNVPHIYAWESSCSYHGYGLAQIALTQWREYFYKKYDYIVDNPAIGKEMRETWKWGASKNFKSSVEAATGKKLSSKAFIKEILLSPEQEISRAKKRLKIMDAVKMSSKAVNLKAEIKMVHGKKVIAASPDSFEAMAQKYGKWVKEMAIES